MMPIARHPRIRRSLHAALLLAGTAAAACMPSPVEWVEGRVTDANGESLVIEADGRVAFVPRTPIQVQAVPALDACPGSLQLTRATATELYGVWWSPRPNGSVSLLSSRSTDGGNTWMAPVPVDTTDRSGRGCARPAPAVASDSSTGYVHVVYYVEGPDGPGLFFSHSMEGGELYHEAVPVVYGRGPVSGAVAADGNTVVVAYEDPNTRRPRVGLQISRTMGHLFEERIPVISGGNVASSEPRVAVRGRTVAVGWVERPTGSRGDEDGTPVVRVGEIR